MRAALRETAPPSAHARSAGAPILECLGVERHFGGLKALKGVDLAIDEGRIVGLVGPNGSGKTTLVNVITGFYPPQQGRVRLYGQDITGMRPYKVAQRAVARTFQNLALFRGMSVLDNILLGRHVHMRPSALASLFYWVWAAREELAHREVVEDVIDFLQLQDIRDEPVEAIAPGLQKRVELARALASEPRLLIKEYIARFILDTRDERGVTILLIEHHMDVVMSLCDEVLVLSSGEPIARGDPRTAIAQPQVVEAYLGQRAAQRSGVDAAQGAA